MPTMDLDLSRMRFMDTEIRGMGNITVCRPLIQCDWEMFPLAKGMVFDSIHKYEKGRRCTQLHETVWMDDEKDTDRFIKKAAGCCRTVRLLAVT